jgi:lipopolysaccharide export system protein LptC
MPRSESWLPLLLLIALAAVTLWLSQAMKIRPPAPPNPVRHEADAIVNNFTATQYDPTGSVRSVLRAEKMLHYPDDGSSRLQAVHFEGREAQQAPFNVRAKEGLVSQDRKDVFFYGDVRAVQESATGQPPLVVTTAKLHVRPDDGTASTDQSVLIEQGPSTATASSLEIDNRTRIAKLTHVRAIYRIPRKQR